MSTVWALASIILPGLAVSLAMYCAHHIGVQAGIREAIIDDARHRDHAVEQMGSQIVRKVLTDGRAVTVLPCPDNPRSVLIGDLESTQVAALEISALAESGVEEIRLVHDSKCGQWVATGLSRHPMGEGRHD